eukprot:scaffold211807_cov26-Tisochrysis_lutea.AAC.3
MQGKQFDDDLTGIVPPSGSKHMGSWDGSGEGSTPMIRVSAGLAALLPAQPFSDVTMCEKRCDGIHGGIDDDSTCTAGDHIACSGPADGAAAAKADVACNGSTRVGTGGTGLTIRFTSSLMSSSRVITGGEGPKSAIGSWTNSSGVDGDSRRGDGRRCTALAELARGWAAREPENPLVVLAPPDVGAPSAS